MSMTYTMSVSSLATTTCLPSGLNQAVSGDLKVCPAARSPGRGNCHIFRPLGSMISTRFPSPSAISRGPGSTDGSEPGASHPGPEAVSEMGPSEEVGATDGCVAEFGLAADACDTMPAAVVGGFAGLPAAAI